MATDGGVSTTGGGRVKEEEPTKESPADDKCGGDTEPCTPPGAPGEGPEPDQDAADAADGLDAADGPGALAGVMRFYDDWGMPMAFSELRDWRQWKFIAGVGRGAVPPFRPFARWDSAVLAEMLSSSVLQGAYTPSQRPPGVADDDCAAVSVYRHRRGVWALIHLRQTEATPPEYCCLADLRPEQGLRPPQRGPQGPGGEWGPQGPGGGWGPQGFQGRVLGSGKLVGPIRQRPRRRFNGCPAHCPNAPQWGQRRRPHYGHAPYCSHAPY